MDFNNYIGQYYKGDLHHKYNEYWHDGNDWGMSFGEFGFSIRYGEVIDFLRNYFPEIEYAKTLLYFNIQYKDFESESNPGNNYCSPTEDFIEVWNMYVNEVPEDVFREAQWNYAKEQYDSTLKAIKSIINPNTHSRLAQEVIWSWSLDSNPEKIKDYISKIEEDDVYDKIQNLPTKDFLDLIYKYRIQDPIYGNDDEYFKSEIEKLKTIYDLYPIKYTGECSSDGTRASGISEVTKYTINRISGYIQSKVKSLTTYNTLDGSLRNNKSTPITDKDWHKVSRRYDINDKSDKFWKLEDSGLYVTANPMYVTFVHKIPSDITDYEKGKYVLLQNMYLRELPKLNSRILNAGEAGVDDNILLGKYKNSGCCIKGGTVIEAEEIINMKHEAWMKYKNGYICIEINGHIFAKNN